MSQSAFVKSKGVPTVNQPADLVITGADVYCGDRAGTWADAVAVRPLPQPPP